MKIPSYDDLTPSIPDIAPGDVFASVERLLPRVGPARMAQERAPSTPTHQAGARTVPCDGRVELYAALHGTPIATLTAIARDFSPRIERHGCTDVVLDVSGLGRLLGDANAIGAELARAGAERVAVVSSQIGARLLARARPGISVGADDVERLLRAIPLTVLQQLTADDAAGTPGPSPASRVTREISPFDVLQRWGLQTLGEFAALPAVDLSARLGQRGLALQQLARGIDPRPLVPDPDVQRFIQSIELEWPIESLEPLSFVFARLLDPLSAALERADRGAAAVRLDLRLTDRTTHTRTLQLPAAMRDARVLRTLLLLDLESHLPPSAVDIVTIEADPAPARIIQYSLLERALPSTETLATLNARLAALTGADRCGTPVLLDTHRPDAFEMKAFNSCRDDGVDSPQRQRRQQRELGDLSVTSVASVVDSSPFSHCPLFSRTHPQFPPVLRRFRPSVAVRVTVERGRPIRMAIDRQGMPGGRVTQAAGPWRTSGAWWDADQPPLKLRRSAGALAKAEALRAKAEGAPWNRDEWDVTVGDGVACRIFRDRHAGVWFLEGVFD